MQVTLEEAKQIKRSLTLQRSWIVRRSNMSGSAILALRKLTGRIDQLDALIRIAEANFVVSAVNRETFPDIEIVE